MKSFIELITEIQKKPLTYFDIGFNPKTDEDVELWYIERGKFESFNLTVESVEMGDRNHFIDDLDWSGRVDHRTKMVSITGRGHDDDVVGRAKLEGMRKRIIRELSSVRNYRFFSWDESGYVEIL